MPPGSSKHSPHPLLAPFNLLLAALVIPLSLPTLQLATPTLLISVLEATLETRIQDALDPWRGSWDRAHRRQLVNVLVRAIDQVQRGLTRRAEVRKDGNVVMTSWRADEVDIDNVVRGREDAIARLVAPLLDIARALGVLPDDSAATPTARVHDIPSPPETPTARTPSRARPTSSLPRIERHSPPRSPAPPTLFAPRPLRAPRPRPPSAPAPGPSPALAAPPSPTRTSRSEPLAPTSPSLSPSQPSVLTPTRPSFLAQVAADRWRSPPPPVVPPPAEAPMRPSAARPSSSAWAASSSSASTSSLDDTFAVPASTRTPRRKAPALAPCTCARPPPLHLPAPPPSVRSPSGATSTTSSPAAKPRRVRLARARLRPVVGAEERRGASSGYELSLHSSTDVEAFERARGAAPTRASLAAAAAVDPDPPAPAPPPPPPPPPAAPLAAADADAPPHTSPYTLLLLAHRERLREKLALLERRERDRREAARRGSSLGEEGGATSAARQGAVVRV
ncbi:hypothetical protein JCM3775_007475 [Rhodotorula graminis]